MTMFTIVIEPKNLSDGDVKDVLNRIEIAFSDVGFYEDGHPKLINID